ncbi:MAG: hypothetical protein DWG76_01910 [Chloroflexi bacterium]|nr:hypothetical protein [Chloroflexota bacterium]MQC26189.1 hypothetical protein [Chloroflexota bacterium]
MAEGNVGRGSGFVVHTEKQPVIIQTQTNRIHGNIHVRENERIKDALNTSDAFVAMTDVTVLDINGMTLLFKSGFLAINRLEVIWVTQDDSKALETPDV